MIVDSRFCGPAGYGNGGYCCGVFASVLDGPAEVTLRAPVPLDTAFEAVVDGDTLEIRAGDGSLFAQATATKPLDDLEPHVRPSVAEAREAATRSPFRTDVHPYPGCFVCGPDHPDGMQIQVGTIAGTESAAAAFVPDESLPAENGTLRRELVWAALDCPSYVPSFWSDDPMLLGRLTTEILAPVPIGEDTVVVAWETGRDGRKMNSASALLDRDGAILARARALWFRVDSKPAPRESR